MKKLLLVPVLSAVALWSGGCGDSCANSATEAKASGAGSCNVVGATPQPPITVRVTPACQSCAQDAPKCDISPLSSSQEQLDVQVRECDSNKGCSGSSCSFGAVSCSFVPAASGAIDVIYRANGTTGTLTVNVGGDPSNTTCTIL